MDNPKWPNVRKKLAEDLGISEEQAEKAKALIEKLTEVSVATGMKAALTPILAIITAVESTIDNLKRRGIDG